MHREILIQCLPCLIALGAALMALVIVVRLSGARLNLRRLRELHACQDGGVQSLSFVLTLPVFIMIVLFIVQVSQLMIGLVTVNYAAYAAARAASVWIPAQVGNTRELENRIALFPQVSDPSERLLIVPNDGSPPAQATASAASYKFSRIRTAAVLGCAPVAPSRDIRFLSQRVTPASADAMAATQQLYSDFVPGSAANARINPRLENKIRYTDRNTLVYVEWRDALNGRGTDSIEGPTYNPVGHPYATIDYNQFGYKPQEVGWQDPVTVYVIHRFALLPGPGRLLADLLVRPIGVSPRIRQRIPAAWRNSAIAEKETYAVIIPAAATMNVEGLKSVRPYVQSTR